MAKVIMKSWREGLQKVSLTKLQAELLKKSLRESKDNVDSLLEGKEVIIEIESENTAMIFLRKAKEIGVECELELH